MAVQEQLIVSLTADLSGPYTAPQQLDIHAGSSLNSLYSLENAYSSPLYNPLYNHLFEVYLDYGSCGDFIGSLYCMAVLTGPKHGFPRLRER